MFTLPAEQLEWVRQAARYQGITASEVLRRAIDHYSRNFPDELKKEIQLGMAEFLKGAGRAGSR